MFTPPRRDSTVSSRRRCVLGFSFRRVLELCPGENLVPEPAYEAEEAPETAAAAAAGGAGNFNHVRFLLDVDRRAVQQSRRPVAAVVVVDVGRPCAIVTRPGPDDSTAYTASTT